ncbi:F-box/WD repeat-containing protein 1A [Tolypocladium ophioglossoides CBS 100239]|uniref:F-box/WD repeat-containing protein 1A n=1 Tax=Tolypocladium ophioglossoides (strain CBS 100239) TaxID=1163406 RepID=A0A0L0MXE6_TOLOC|nr:F-box/WD repeat-containing protein 1A [Tolypocladium ophioglossoides CBS 100239]
MNKGDRFPPATMDPFAPVHHTDEGYSEDPINPTLHQSLPAAVSTLGSSADLPSWLVNNASALPMSVKTELTMALLDQLPTSAIAEIVQRLNPRLYIDFIQYLPAEICLKVLGYLDPVSLVCVMQTCRTWYDLALDRKLWERLYYLEGWKAIQGDIDAWEARVNTGLNHSIGHLHRIQNADGHKSKVRALLNDDEDMEMMDNDHYFPPANQGSGLGGSIFGSPTSSLSNRLAMPPIGGDTDMDTSFSSNKGKSVDRGFGSLDHVVRAKRKEPGGSPEPSLPLPLLLPADIPGACPVRSTLWMWDINSSRYRINWKYLYNMRRRLESNWELGKFTTFQLPHPLHPEEGHQECVYTLQFDANYLVSGSRDQTMRIWNMHTRRLVRPPLAGHHGSVLCLQFDADPAEDILVSGSSDSNVFIWKFSTGELLQKITKAHRESVLNVRFDKRILVTSSKDKTIKIFNRRPLWYGDLGYGTSDAVVNPIATNMRRYGFEPDLAQELPVKEPYTMIGSLEGHGAAVNAIQVRDRTIVSVSGDRHIKVWNWPDQVCTQTIPAHDKGIACVEFDERRIVSGSSDYEVCIFDAPTGLKVAQLRGHAHLVRTVQAGFGDLPYSRAEDEAEAKAVDAEYFRAVEAGEILHETERRSRRSRRVNAGSSRPAEIQAFGAKVPPGGGGGRKYGRIVSGSYDQSIIIWRRDKEGVWKPAHHLRQEEAAAAALRHMTASFGQPSAALPSSSQGSVLLHGSSVRPLGLSSSRSRGANPPLVPAIRDPHVDSHSSAGLYMALIDQVVPLGAPALEQALANYPVMLAYNTYLQTTVEREPSPFVRSQLRQAVTRALVAIQNGQSARQRLGAVGTPRPPVFNAPTAGPPGNGGDAHQHGAGASLPDPPQPVFSTPDALGHDTQVQAPTAMPVPIPLAPAARPAQVPSPTQQQQQQPPPPTTAPGQGNAQPTHHHPHIAAAENAPARVFKLQFDARKIVCCSQAPVIVGWDFCNGEAELEETARFFATVD